MNAGIVIPSNWLSIPSNTIVSAVRETSHFWYAVHGPSSMDAPVTGTPRLVEYTADIVLREAGHCRLRADEIVEVGDLPPAIEGRGVFRHVEGGGHPPREALRAPGAPQPP